MKHKAQESDPLQIWDRYCGFGEKYYVIEKLTQIMILSEGKKVLVL